MSLTEIPVPSEATLAARAIPADAERLIAEAKRRIEAFFERTRDDPVPAFVPCDFRAAYRALAWVREARLAPGRSLCEWGSGFGVVALLGSMLGYYASGIEVERQLVAAAGALAEDFDLAVEFVQGSFVPEGAEESPELQEELAWLDYSAAPAYEALGSDPDDFDVVFAYPWPGEQQVVYELFDAHGASGALLLTYEGKEGVRAHRRDRPPRRRR